MTLVLYTLLTVRNEEGIVGSLKKKRIPEKGKALV
jgi:hypothetical protein